MLLASSSLPRWRTPRAPMLSTTRRHTRWKGDWSSDVCSSDLSCGFIWMVNWTARKLLHLHLDQARPIWRWASVARSEERRVGKECRSRWAPYQEQKTASTSRRRYVSVPEARPKDCASLKVRPP